MISLISVLVEIIDQQSTHTDLLEGYSFWRISQYNIIDGFQLISVPGKNQYIHQQSFSKYLNLV